MWVAGYARVSPTDRETETIEIQIERIQAWVQSQGWKLFRIYIDNMVSGETPMELRPEGSEMLRDAAEGRFEVLVSVRIDRLGRNTLDSLTVARRLKESGVRYLSITEPFDTSGPFGEFVFTLFAAVAQQERVSILDRTGVGKRKQVREGRWGGGNAPYGYLIVEKHLQINPDTAPVVHRIFRLFREGVSMTEIADTLNAEGVPGPMAGMKRKGRVLGGEWHFQQISRILRNRLYCGSGSYGKLRPVRKDGKRIRQERTDPETWIPFDVPQLITEEVFADTQHLISTLSKCGPKPTKHEYLLVGRAVCAVCGLPMYGTMGGSRGDIPFYRCRSKVDRKESLCGARYVHGRHLEEAVWQEVAARISNPEGVLRDLQAGQPPAADHTEEIAALRRSIVEAEKERQEVYRIHRRGLMNDRDLEIQLAEVQAQVSAAHTRLDILEDRQRAEKETAAAWLRIEDLVRRSAAMLETPSDRYRFLVVRSVVAKVSVYKDDEGIHAEVFFRFDEGCKSNSCAVGYEADIHSLGSLVSKLRGVGRKIPPFDG